MTENDEIDHYRYLASLIERYLADHPDALDDLEGIMDWWIPRQKLKESEDAVSRALEILLKKGVITRDKDGRYRYALH